MSVQDAVFLPSRTSFSNTFLKNCGRDKSLGTTTCPKTVVGGKQGHATCNIPLLQQSLFLSAEINGDHKSATKMR